jgi:hypothetical protein
LVPSIGCKENEVLSIEVFLNHVYEFSPVFIYYQKGLNFWQSWEDSPSMFAAKIYVNDAKKVL